MGFASRFPDIFSYGFDEVVVEVYGGVFHSQGFWCCVCGIVVDLVIILIGIVFSLVMWVEMNLSIKVSELKLLRLNLTMV